MNNSNNRRLGDIDSATNGGWVEHGDGTRTHVGSPYGPNAGHATSSDGRAYRKDFFRGWERDPIYDAPRPSGADQGKQIVIWEPPQNTWHPPGESASQPGGCGILGFIVGAIWLGFWFCAFVYDWWRQSPKSLLAVGTGIVIAIIILPVSRWLRRLNHRNSPGPEGTAPIDEVDQLPLEEGASPELEVPQPKPQQERVRPRTAAELDIYD